MSLRWPVFDPPDLELLGVIRAAVTSMPADVVLLSGGVDSSVLVSVDPTKPAVTVGMADGSDDLAAAEVVAQALGLDWHPVRLSRSTALDRLAELVVRLSSFNLELLNHIPLYVGGQVAQSLTSSGAVTVHTGEFADELFRGYVYLYDYPTDRYRQQLPGRARGYQPPSQPVFAGLGLTGGYPYLAGDVVSYAAALSRQDNVIDCVCTMDGDDHTARAGGPAGPRLRRWGKAALRRAARGLGLLPETIVARPKQDLEYGSGTVCLEEDLARLAAPDEIDEYERSGIRFLSASRAAHAGLYKLYRAAGLAPVPPTGPDQRACRGCGGAVRPQYGDHCATCGRYPASAS